MPCKADVTLQFSGRRNGQMLTFEFVILHTRNDNKTMSSVRRMFMHGAFMGNGDEMSRN